MSHGYFFLFLVVIYLLFIYLVFCTSSRLLKSRLGYAFQTFGPQRRRSEYSHCGLFTCMHKSTKLTRTEGLVGWEVSELVALALGEVPMEVNSEVDVVIQIETEVNVDCKGAPPKGTP